MFRLHKKYNTLPISESLECEKYACMSVCARARVCVCVCDYVCASLQHGLACSVRDLDCFCICTLL
jgi:hypothetical protein